MPPSTQPAQRVSRVDTLVDALRVRILTGEIGPGVQLREVELATEFGVGRHSLRAALQALVHEGLVRHEPNRGVFVPRVSAADVADLFRFRIALECEAARAVTGENLPLPAAEAAVLELESLTGRERWDEVIEMDLRFHRALISGLDSPRITRAFGSLQAELLLLLAQLQRVYERPESIGAEHRTVLDALRSGDVARAETAVRAHLERGIEDIVGIGATATPPMPAN